MNNLNDPNQNNYLYHQIDFIKETHENAKQYYEQANNLINNLDNDTYDSNPICYELNAKIEVHNNLCNDIIQQLHELELLSTNASPAMISEIKNELQKMMG